MTACRASPARRLPLNLEVNKTVWLADIPQECSFVFLRGIGKGQVMIKSQSASLTCLLVLTTVTYHVLGLEKPLMSPPFHIFLLLQSKGRLPASLSVSLLSADGFAPQLFIFFSSKVKSMRMLQRGNW